MDASDTALTSNNSWAETMLPELKKIRMLVTNSMTPKHVAGRTLLAATIATIAGVAAAWLISSYSQSDAAVSVSPAPLPQVVVSRPLVREVGSRLSFLGQFSAVEQVEIRPQVGGTLTGIHFKDGDVVHKDDLLFTIDSRPFER